MKRDIGLDEACHLLEPAVHRTVRAAQLGHGSFVTLSLVNTDGYSTSEYYLWVYCAGWNVSDRERIMFASEDDRGHIAASVGMLNDLHLESICIDYPSLSLSLVFAEGVTMSVVALCSAGYEHWMWRLPSGEWLVAGPGTELLIEEESTRRSAG